MLDLVASYVPFSNGLCSELSELISSFSLSEHASAFKRKARLACAIGATVMGIKLCDYRTNPRCLSMKSLSSKQKPYQRVRRPACLGYTKLMPSDESNPPFVGALPVKTQNRTPCNHMALSAVRLDFPRPFTILNRPLNSLTTIHLFLQPAFSLLDNHLPNVLLLAHHEIKPSDSEHRCYHIIAH